MTTRTCAELRTALCRSISGLVAKSRRLSQTEGAGKRTGIQERRPDDQTRANAHM